MGEMSKLSSRFTRFSIVLCMLLMGAVVPHAYAVDEPEPITDIVGQAVLMAQDEAEAAGIPTEVFSVDGVNYQVCYWGEDGSYYALVRGFTDSSDAREDLVIPDEVASPLDSSVTFHVESVGEAAFMLCTNLKHVTFAGSLGGRIGGSAFAACSSLESVTFADDCVLSRKGVIDRASNGDPFGGAVFVGCKALKSIEIPPLVSATSKNKDEYTAGWMLWHGQDTPVSPNGAGLSTGIFNNCTSLESVVFRAGHSEGAYAYFPTKSGYFTDCSNLKSLVFECKQSFWMNPDSAYAATTGASTWDWGDYADVGEGCPTLYYAVDYYASESQALNDAAEVTPNCTHSNRLARVDYARGTSMASIATNTATGFASVDGHPQTSALTNAAPDAATAAGHAGEAGWIWKFEQPYGFCETLTESCYAYPAKANDLSAGHVDSSALQRMRVVSCLYLEKWFDIDRYTRASGAQQAGGDTPQGILYLYRNDAYTGDASHTLLLDGSFKQRIKVSAADGSTLTEGRDYVRTFRRYDEETSAYTDDMDVPDGEGPYLMRLSGAAGSSYEGSVLEVWIYVQGHAISFSTTKNIGENSGAAALTSKVIGTGSTYGNKAAPYAVLLDDQNSVMLYLGCAFAGFADAVPVPTTNGEYGAALGVVGTVLSGSSTKRILAVGVSRQTAFEVEMNGVRVAPDRYDYGTSIDTAPKLASAAYSAFNRDKTRNGVSDKTWGSTAVLLPVNVPIDCMAMAAYAYSMKAPVFFAEADGSVSTTTLDCLKGFDVVVPGGQDVTAAKTVNALTQAGLNVTRIGEGYDGQCDFSLMVADALVDAGAASYSTVTIVEGCDALRMSSALATSGYSGGVVLVSGGIGDTKRIIAHLAEKGYADSMNRVYLMETGDSVLSTESWSASEQIRSVISGKQADTAVVAGDVVSSDGALYQITATGGTELASRYDDERGASSEPVDISNATVSGLKSKTYTGKAQTQNVKVTVDGVQLAEGADKDYTLSYANNVNAGKAKMTFTGVGSYTGTLTKTFVIDKASQSFSVKATAQNVSLSKVKKSKTQVKPFKVSNARGSVTFAKAGGSAQLTVKAKTGAVVVKKGTSKGTYKIKVNVTAAGNSNYKKAVKTMTAKVKVK